MSLVQFGLKKTQCGWDIIVIYNLCDS